MEKQRETPPSEPTVVNPEDSMHLELERVKREEPEKFQELLLALAKRKSPSK